MIRANYYGSHYDQRGTIDGPSPSAKLGSEVFVDLELGYNFNDNLRFLVGASNVFDAVRGQDPSHGHLRQPGTDLRQPLEPGHALCAPRRGQLRGRFLVRAGRLQLVGISLSV